MVEPKRLFLIDDDEDDRHFFDLCIKDFDRSIEVYCAKSCELALASVSDSGFPVPDVFFVDWNMPKRCGAQCIVAIRNVERVANVPIVVFSTSSADADKARAYSLGALLFVTKPCSVTEMATKLKDIFQQLFHKQ